VSGGRYWGGSTASNSEVAGATFRTARSKESSVRLEGSWTPLTFRPCDCTAASITWRVAAAAQLRVGRCGRGGQRCYACSCGRALGVLTRTSLLLGRGATRDWSGNCAMGNQ